MRLFDHNWILLLATKIICALADASSVADCVVVYFYNMVDCMKMVAMFSSDHPV